MQRCNKSVVFLTHRAFLSYQKSIVLALGGHIIASDKPAKDIAQYRNLDFFVIPKGFHQRTIKLCSALAGGFVDIVTDEWVEDSRKEGAFLPADGYAPLHLLGAIGNAISALPRGGVLGEYLVHVCSNVTGTSNGKPPKTELRAMIESAGGTVIPQISLHTAATKGNLLVITSSEDDDITAPRVAAVMSKAPFIPLRNLFDILISQSLDDLTPFNFTTEPETLEDAAPSKMPPGELETPKPTPTPQQLKAPTSDAGTSNSPKKSHLAGLKLKLSPLQSPLKYYLAKKKEKEIGGDEGINTSNIQHEIPSRDPFKTPAKKVESEDHFQSSKAELKDDDSFDFITPHANPRVSNFEQLFTIKLTLSPERTTSRSNNRRQQLGSNGMLSIFGCKLTNVTHVIYIDEEGVKVFDAELELGCLSEVYEFVKGNGGSEPFFFWEAHNKAHAAGGTTIKGAETPNEAVGFRRFYFTFEEPGDHITALFYVFNENIDIVREFFKGDGKMTETKKSLPAHAINVDDDEMDTDEDGIFMHAAPIAGIEIEEEVGYNPAGESQPLW